VLGHRSSLGRLLPPRFSRALIRSLTVDCASTNFFALATDRTERRSHSGWGKVWQSQESPEAGETPAI